MRIAVMGSGALGGFFGAVLARAGEEVVLIARGAQLVAIRDSGLSIRSQPFGDFTVAPIATDDPTEVGVVDLVLFCVKAYDLDAAAEAMLPLVGPRTVVLPLQNGVDVAVRLARYLPSQQIVGGVCYVSALVEAPGVVAHRGGERLLIGELAGGTSLRSERLIETLVRAGIAAELRPNIRADLWIKFMGACSGSLTALTRLPIGAILACPETAALSRGLMEEVAAVARASRVELETDAVTRLAAELGTFEPMLYASQYHDLVAGRQLELETLNGTVVRLGRERDVPTPLNFAVYAALKPFVDGPPAGPPAVERPGGL